MSDSGLFNMSESSKIMPPSTIERIQSQILVIDCDGSRKRPKHELIKHHLDVTELNVRI